MDPLASNQVVGSSNLSGRAKILWSVPDTWVTDYTEDIGNTFGPKGSVPKTWVTLLCTLYDLNVPL